MGLIRTLFFLLIGAIVWFAIRNYLRKQEMRNGMNNGNGSDAAQAPAKIVKCQYCAVHLPEPEAIAYKQQWFCSPAHMERWLEQHKS